MKLHKTLSIFFFGCLANVFSQAPSCGNNYFYQSGNAGCIWYHPAETPTISLGGYFILPSTASGLAIGPNFAGPGPNPTYWTVVNGNYYFYNGNSFVNTGHSAGGSGFTNPGAGANFIYNINAQGQVSKYDGTGSASIIATYSDCAGTAAVQDIAGDASDNYYILKTSAPQSLNVFNPGGSMICSYSMSNCPVGIGLAINRGQVSVLTNTGNSAYTGILQSNSIIFTGPTLLPCSTQNDLASCASDVLLVPNLRAVPDGTLPCLGGNRVLTSDDALSAFTYSWTGPGIQGVVNTQSISASLPGVYTRTVMNCTGFTDVQSFTLQQSSVAPLSVSQSAMSRCENDPPVSLSAGGLSSYTWSPGASLSSVNGSTVMASPGVTTTYTVAGSQGGCTGTAFITLNASPIGSLQASASAPVICAGASVNLSTQVQSLTVTWQPGNLTGQPYPVMPLNTTIYTAQVTNSLGCSKTDTVQVTVFETPTVAVQLSANQICKGQSIQMQLNGASMYTVQPGNLNGTNISLMPAANTAYTITGANWNCISNTVIGTTVYALPQVSITSSSGEICAGESLTLVANGATSYNWPNGSNTPQQTFVPFSSFTISVTGTSAEGCSATSTFEQKVSECTGIAEVTPGDYILLGPNPGNGIFTIKNGSGKKLTMIVRNYLGQQVESEELPVETSCAIRDAKAGIYFIDIIENGRSIRTMKYILQQ